MIQEQGLTRQRIFSELAKSPHGKLEEYLPVGRQASREARRTHRALVGRGWKIQCTTVGFTHADAHGRAQAK